MNETKSDLIDYATSEIRNAIQSMISESTSFQDISLVITVAMTKAREFTKIPGIGKKEIVLKVLRDLVRERIKSPLAETLLLVIDTIVSGAIDAIAHAGKHKIDYSPLKLSSCFPCC